MSLEEKAAEFTAATGIPLSYIIILHEDGQGQPPDGLDAKTYAEQLGLTMPVTADPASNVLDATPWDGQSLPGKCAMSPDMVMLACYTGEDDTEAFDAIKGHAGL